MTWDPLKKAKESKRFCIYPWIHQYVGAHGDVKPCCIYNYPDEIGNLKENTFEEVWNNDKTKQLRLDMLNGVTRVECNECNLREEYSSTTSRKRANEMYFDNDKELQDVVSSTKRDGSLPEHKLYYMDVRFNTLCNLKCLTCSPYFSSALIEDYKKVYDKEVAYSFAGKTEEDAYNQMLPHLATMRQVYFAGGEPMMQKEHFMTLEKLIEINHYPTLLYNTNFSRLTLGKYDVIKYWQKFKNVYLNASLDANYERAEYWRNGTKWSAVVDNRKRLQDEAPHVKFIISTTLSWPNAFNVIDLHKEWYELGFIGINDILINPIYQPEFFSLLHVPMWKKEQVITAYKRHIHWLKSIDNSQAAVWQYENLISFLNNSYTEDEKEIGVFYNKHLEWLKTKNDSQDQIKHFENLMMTLRNTSERKKFPGRDFHKVITKTDKIRNKNKSFFEVFPEHKDLESWLTQQSMVFEKNFKATGNSAI